MLDEKGFGRFEPGSQTVLELDTSQAGPGYMQAEVLTQYGEVKSKVEASRDNRKCLLKFTPQESVQVWPLSFFPVCFCQHFC